MAPFTSDGTENRMRWDRASTGFMEVWYVTAHHRASGCGVWFRYTLTAPKAAPPYCRLWGFVFDPDGKRSFAAARTFPIDVLGSTNGRDDGALVRIGDAWLSETHLEGRVERDTRTLSWSLDLEPAEKCFQHLPRQLRSRVARRVSTVCSPNLAVPFHGVVTIDGEELIFDGECGSQSHRWGARHPTTWSWAHGSTFEEDAGAVFEGLAAQATIGPVPAPTSTFLYVRYQGEDLAFNDMRWALRARSHYEMPTWAFTARNERWKVAGAARAVPDRLIQVRYEDPDGSSRYCANSEIADLALEVYERASTGWRHRGSLTSLRTAHLEFGRRRPFEELPITL